MVSETFYDLHDKPFQPEMHAFVGGNSKFYGAALFRLLPQNFTGVTHPQGVTPAWPITYDDLEPFYARAERLYGARRSRQGPVWWPLQQRVPVPGRVP